MNDQLVATLLSLLLTWLISTAVLYFAGLKLGKKHPDQPVIWTLLLTFTFIPLLPLSEYFILATAADNFPVFSQSIERVELVAQVSLASAKDNVLNYISLNLLGCYCLTALFFLSRVAINWFKIKSFINHCTVVTVENCDYSVVMMPSNSSSFAFGLFKPVIALPNYYQNLTKSQQQILVQHEITHLQHRDSAMVLLWQILGALCFFNPFLAKMEAQFIKAMENRCDRRTIKRLNISAKEYAQTLLHSLKLNQRSTHSLAQFSSTALTISDYKSRIFHIMRPAKNSRTQLALHLFFILVGLSIAKIAIASVASSQKVNWQYPLENYRISSPYGEVAKFRKMRPHGGVDMVAPKGTPIMAAADGVVIVADNSSLPTNYGNVVMLQHANGMQSLYSHLELISVDKGSWISQGQHIGTVGETGNTTGAHLHFEVFKDNYRINPKSVLEKQ